VACRRHEAILDGHASALCFRLCSLPFTTQRCFDYFRYHSTLLRYSNVYTHFMCMLFSTDVPFASDEVLFGCIDRVQRDSGGLYVNCQEMTPATSVSSIAYPIQLASSHRQQSMEQ